MGPLFFLLYINDLPYAISNLSTPILFADDTSLIVSNLENLKFGNDVNELMHKLKTWFRSNLLVLNLEKTHFLQFQTKNSNDTQLQEKYDNIQLANKEETKFLGLIIDNKLTWQSHVNMMSSKLNAVSYVMRSLRQILNTDMLKNVYFSLVHSILSYGIIFWGISRNSITIFKIQKRIIRIIMNVNSKTSCRNLFKKLKILPLPSQYIYSLMIFVVKNNELFITNANVHKNFTRSNNDLHLPIANLSVFQRGVYFTGIKVFNSLPVEIKKTSYDIRSFKNALKSFLLENSFYSLEEYFNWKMNLYDTHK